MLPTFVLHFDGKNFDEKKTKFASLWWRKVSNNSDTINGWRRRLLRGLWKNFFLWTNFYYKASFFVEVKWVKRLFIEVRKININLRWWNNFKLFKSLNSVPNKKDLGQAGQDFWNYISMRGISIIFYFGILQEYIYIHHKNASYFLWLCFNPLWINTMWY